LSFLQFFAKHHEGLMYMQRATTSDKESDSVTLPTRTKIFTSSVLVPKFSSSFKVLFWFQRLDSKLLTVPHTSNWIYRTWF